MVNCEWLTISKQALGLTIDHSQLTVTSVPELHVFVEA